MLTEIFFKFLGLHVVNLYGGQCKHFFRFQSALGLIAKGTLFARKQSMLSLQTHIAFAEHSSTLNN